MIRLINGLYVSCYLTINWVVFEFVNFNTIIIRVVFRLANTVENMYVDTSRTRHTDTNCEPRVMICIYSQNLIK